MNKNEALPVLHRSYRPDAEWAGHIDEYTMKERLSFCKERVRCL